MTLAVAAAWESVVAAAVTAITAAGVAIWQGNKTRQTNSQEHGNTTQHLLELHHKVDRVVDKLDEHTKDHRHDL